MGKRLAAAAVIASIVALASPAPAADDVPASVRVDAPATCTSEPAFWAALERRTTRLRRARANEEAAAIEITMRTGDATGSATGELRIVRAGAASEVRRFTAASCEELTQGMSLVAALAFDPAARLEPAPPPDVAPTPAPPADAPAAPPRKPADPRDAAPSWRFGGGLSFGGSTVTSEIGAPAFGAFFDVQHQRGWLTTLRAGFARSTTTATEGTVSADLAWTVGRLALCPLRKELANGALSVMPCAGIDVGVLSAAANGVTRASDQSRAWALASVLGRLEVQPVRSFFFELQAGAGFPFIRDEIAVDPSVTLFRAPAVVAVGEIGVGVRFP